MRFMGKKILFPRREDPFLKREQRLYVHPLPSREYIQHALKTLNRPVFFKELIHCFGILHKEEEDFLRRLNAMAKSAQILCNRAGAYLLPDRAHLISGTVEGHKDGFGFCIPDDGSDSIFLNVKQMRNVLPGDKVLVQTAMNEKHQKLDGKIVEITARRTAPIVGRVFSESGVFWLIPLDKTITHEILLAKTRQKFEKNSVLTVEIIEPPAKRSPPIGRIVENLGNQADSGIEIEIALRKFNLPFAFSKQAQKECNNLAEQLSFNDFKNRKDLRHLPFVTIDGADSKDFDDAVFAQKTADGFELFVAIADVAHYVLPKTALDLAARERGNSVYFPRRVIPMLPEKLSNNLCSLNPNVDRLVLVCQMQIGARGKIKTYSFFEGVIHSFARLTYDEVFDCFNQKKLPDYLKNLYSVFNALLMARHRRFALDFNLKESQIVFNQNNQIENIIPKKRNHAHCLIEECMLAANVCAADFLKKSPSIFRIHESPTLKKLESLNNFLKYLGLKLNYSDPIQTKDYSLLLKNIQKRADFEMLQMMLLRSLQKAVYSVDNVGHFGLAYEHYTHFTSPIRRYSDLIIHRLIKEKLNCNPKHHNNKNNKNNNKKLYSLEELENTALHCSYTEKQAEEASREVLMFLKCQFMENKINQVFSGTISNITSFGVFVLLDDYDIDGLIHIAELGEDYFHFNLEKQCLIGENSKQVYSLGMRLNVQLVRVDLEDLKIDFVVEKQSKKSTVNAKKISKKINVDRGKNKIKQIKKQRK